ncbi:MAG: efflux RND transporter periplasmic adaptor subunit, partial [Planctomycetota bacterium]
AGIGRYAGLVVLLLAALVVGYVLRGGCAPATSAVSALRAQEGPEAGEGGGEEAVATVWTCSMHPQIRQPKPGRCPICAMPLIPITSGDNGEGEGMREFKTGEAALKLMDIQTAPVERRFVTAKVRLVGKVTYDETRVGYITAWVPGRLDRLYVDYTGVRVNKGDHLVYIYSPELLSGQEELLQARRAVEELSRSDMDIMRETAQATLEAARDKLRLWGLKEEQIRETERRGTASDHMTIYAPMSGTVVDKNAQEGMYVATGTRIYTIADLGHVWVKLDAYESDLVWLRYGQKVTFTTEAYPGETVVGRLAFIDPVVDPKTRTVRVRVNVPNPDGMLKPEMFVRGIVRANVGGQGRVMDPDLLGKWICPMHPEVVKSQAAACDICGMDLVTPESLGYVTPASDRSDRPLVIPATAPLITGTRAVVYVEVPGAERPTFEGREIVLGPRAGDYYIVRHGLKEGEMVVTRGNFKIDSALQIQAKPSMMTPAGGGGAAAHAHHAAEPEETPGAAQAREEPEPAVPVPFREEMRRVLAAHDAVKAALRTEDLGRARSAFAGVGRAVEAADEALLSGHPRAMWEELAMLIGNDAFEGAGSESLEEARRAFESLEANAQRLAAQFGLAHEHEAPRPEEEPALEADQEQVPAAFREQIGPVLAAYLVVYSALAEDDWDGAAKGGGAIEGALGAVDMGLLGHEAHRQWMEALSGLRGALDGLGQAGDIEEGRAAFAALSQELAGVLRWFGAPPGESVHVLRCPMALGGSGAIWLQRRRETHNPYLTSMQKCGAVIEVIGGDRPVSEGGHRHE